MSTQTDLDDAKVARHKLLTGTATVEVRTEEGTVKYNVADLPLLEAYIARLSREVAGQTSRAIGVMF